MFIVPRVSFIYVLPTSEDCGTPPESMIIVSKLTLGCLTRKGQGGGDQLAPALKELSTGCRRQLHLSDSIPVPSPYNQQCTYVPVIERESSAIALLNR